MQFLFPWIVIVLISERSMSVCTPLFAPDALPPKAKKQLKKQIKGT